jgi:putative ABC transport system permease protein
MLVGLQFILSFLFILMALFVGVQTRFMIGRDMGFDEARVLQTWCGYPAGNQKDALKSHLLQNPSIEAVTFADGQNTANLVITYNPDNLEYGQEDALTLQIGDASYTTAYGLSTFAGSLYVAEP